MHLLQQDFYKIKEQDVQENTLKAVIVLNAKNEVYQGHFPGQPVLPGVCMLQISQELIEQHLGNELLMKATGQVKFLSMVDPNKVNEIEIVIKSIDNLERVQVEWQLPTGEKILKYTAEYEKI